MDTNNEMAETDKKFDDGGLAFPGRDYETRPFERGMTLWDHYAGQAMQGLAACWIDWDCVDGMSKEDESLIIGDIETGDCSPVAAKQMAEMACMLADAMIAEKRKREAK